MKTWILLNVLLVGALAAPRQAVPYGKKPPPGEKSKKPLPESLLTALDDKKPPPEDKKTLFEDKKPAPGEKQVTDPTPSPRQANELDCGSHVIAEGSSYVIRSPNYPNNYPNFQDCTYTLTTTTDKDIEVTCNAFNLESHYSCRYDWLKINDVKYCGSTAPPSLASSPMEIEFHSDYSVVRSGYECSITLAEPVVPPAGSTLDCGTSHLGRGQYTITDGAGDYSNDVDCYYNLQTTEDGDQISVTCSSFDVESHSRCSYDWLKLDDTKFCGTNGPNGVTALSEMDIHWHTDYSVVKAGFECSVDVSEPPPPPSPQPPASCSCGNVNRATRIVGGTQTEVNEYPWQAGLVNPGATRTWCGGTVINSMYVLTAAHCTAGESPGSFQVLLREHVIGSGDGEIRADVQQIKDHPSYNSGTLDNDFSLLKLASEITFPADNTLAPACLPTAGNDFDGQDAVVTGWGTTSSGGSQANALREVTVPIISNAACQSAYSGYTITGNMVCAGLVGTGGKDSCQGDSGGPLVSLEGGKYSLAGVVSWGIGCADSRYPGVYARVTAALQWIETNAIDGAYCST